MITTDYDVAVIGAGPAGLAAALAADERGAKTLLIERESKLGGMLKQCIHDGFGFERFGEKLSGPEYVHRFTSQIPDSGIKIAALTFVTRIEKKITGFHLTLVNREGVNKTTCRSLVLACGSRERTFRQVGIHGRYSAGIFTAGTAQYYINILGKMPAKRCVILGSDDAGLIIARRLKIEGAEVIGVFEERPAAAGQIRNVCQCLEDYDIPLYTNKTITRVFGEGHLNSVEISSVNENMLPVSGTEKIIDCDTIIVSAGLVPENELAEKLGITLDSSTKGPITDQNCMTMTDGIFCCGNALHVNTFVDYVSESGEIAGQAAANWSAEQPIYIPQNSERSLAMITSNNNLSYIVPQMLNVNELNNPVIFNFRSKNEMGKSLLLVELDGIEIFRKFYQQLRPQEMERLELDLKNKFINKGSVINFLLKEIK